MLEDGAFLGALAAVSSARGGELLLDLIVSDDAAAAGAYTFQFFKHGTWQQVAVDNYLPCLADQVGETCGVWVRVQVCVLGARHVAAGGGGQLPAVPGGPGGGDVRGVG